MTTVVPLVSKPAVPKHRWTTPGALWRMLWAIWLCDVLLLCALLFAERVHYSSLKTIGRDAAPSIIAAQEINSSLADMDADAANELLADPSAAALAVQAYNARRQQAAAALIAAAQNITYGDAERLPILHIQLALGRYEALIQRARDLREEHNPAFLSTYEQAAQILDSTIVPAADALDAANMSELERAYSSQGSSSGRASSFVALAATAVLLLLILLQIYLFKRTHRVINIALLLASVLVIIYGEYAVAKLNRAERDLKVAKEDAFTSIHALWRAWAVAYSANADESRLLLDPKNAAQHTADFMRKRDEIAKLPPGETYETVEHWSRAPQFSGYLADELNNITFPGEGQAALDTVDAFAHYVTIAGRVRELEQQGKHKEAIALYTGTAPGESGWAFYRFSAALARTLKINQDAFDSSVKAGFAELAFFDGKAAIFSAILAIIVLFGLLPRIREYN